MNAPFIAAIVALIGLLFVAWHERRKRFVAACDTFRAAFADSLLNLTEHDVPLAQAVHTFRFQHLAAIQAFRLHLGYFRRRGFDKARQEYDRCCTLAEPDSVIMQFASEKTEHAQENRKRMISTIQCLISYAK